MQSRDRDCFFATGQRGEIVDRDIAARSKFKLCSQSNAHVGVTEQVDEFAEREFLKSLADEKPIRGGLFAEDDLRIEDRVNAASQTLAGPVEIDEVGDVHLAVVTELDVGRVERLEEIVSVDDLEAGSARLDGERLDAACAGVVTEEKVIGISAGQSDSGIVREARRAGSQWTNRRHDPRGL